MFTELYVVAIALCTLRWRSGYGSCRGSGRAGGSSSGAAGEYQGGKAVEDGAAREENGGRSGTRVCLHLSVSKFGNYIRTPGIYLHFPCAHYYGMYTRSM